MSNTPLTTTSVEDLIKIAADTIAQLRKPDVLRVLETYPTRRQELAQFITQRRPDLAQEVNEVMMELYLARAAFSEPNTTDQEA